MQGFERGKAAVLALAALASLPSPVSAHEPLQGFGPNTIWKGGFSGSFGVEESAQGPLMNGDELLHDRTHTHVHATTARLEALYGITPHIQVRASARILYEETTSNEGPRDVDERFESVELAAKWRFYKGNELGNAIQAAVEAAVLAKGSGDGARPTIGLALSRDTLSLYLWSDVRASVDTEARARPNVAGIASFDAAAGFHLWTVEYGKPDLIPLVELNSTFESPRRDRGRGGLGGFVQAVSPGFLFFFDAFELKGSLRVPLYQRVHGTQYSQGIEGILELEYHY